MPKAYQKDRLVRFFVIHLQVSGENGATSSTYNFTTPPAAGSFPFTLGVFADLGETYNSSATLDRMLAQNPEAITLIGDWT